MMKQVEQYMELVVHQHSMAVVAALAVVDVPVARSSAVMGLLAGKNCQGCMVQPIRFQALVEAILFPGKGQDCMRLLEMFYLIVYQTVAELVTVKWVMMI
jgi:hypothetical protein